MPQGGTFNVQLNINMPLRCAEPPHRIVILDADVSPTRIRIRESWEHDPELATWWPQDQTETAFAVLEEMGLSWLDRNSDPTHLIAYFEQRYSERKQALSQKSPRGWFGSILHGRSNRGNVPTAHYQYLLWLSQLYEVQGDMAMARERLDQYTIAVRDRNLVAELERLEHHRAALG